MTPTCHCLRWKGYHRNLTPEGIEIAFLRNHVPYSCLRTARPWGPDGDVAAPETCTSERDCYEPRESLGARIARIRKASA